MTADLALILFSLFLVLLNGFFVAAEFSIVKLRHTRVAAIETSQGWRGRILGKVHAHLDAYLSACQLGITLASLGLGWIGEPAFAALLEPLFYALVITDPDVVHAISFFVAFMTISYLHIVVGELAPKSVAIRMSEPVGLWTAWPLYGFYWAMYPLIWGLNHSAAWLLRRVGLDLAGEHEGGYSSDELKLILRSSHAESGLSPDERNAVMTWLDLSQLEVADFMRPFAEAIVLRDDDSVEANLRTVAMHRLSRYPYVNQNGEVTGVIYLKDLFLHLQQYGQIDSLQPLLRPALTVSASTPARHLLRRFRNDGSHLAIVTLIENRPIGFLTFDDLLSSLVGDIRDEFSKSRNDWSRLSDGSLLVKGSLSVFSLRQALNLNLPDTKAHTIAGMIMDKLQRLPSPDECVELGNHRFEVKRMDGARIVQVRITTIPDSDDLKD